jgi:DNA-directed RNA polymerase specialized sigma24 family protein
MPLAHNHQLDARPATARFVPPPPPPPPPRPPRNGNGRALDDVDSTVHAAILRRAQLLLPRDRSIVELTLKGNLSRQVVARTLGLAPGSVSRRLQRLSARLHDPLVVALLAADCPLSPEYRQVGVEHFLQGLPATDIADKHRMSAEQIRKTIASIRHWHELRGKS